MKYENRLKQLIVKLIQEVKENRIEVNKLIEELYNLKNQGKTPLF